MRLSLELYKGVKRHRALSKIGMESDVFEEKGCIFNFNFIYGFRGFRYSRYVTYICSGEKFNTIKNFIHLLILEKSGKHQKD